MNPAALMLTLALDWYREWPRIYHLYWFGGHPLRIEVFE